MLTPRSPLPPSEPEFAKLLAQVPTERLPDLLLELQRIASLHFSVPIAAPRLN